MFVRISALASIKRLNQKQYRHFVYFSLFTNYLIRDFLQNHISKLTDLYLLNLVFAQLYIFIDCKNKAQWVEMSFEVSILSYAPTVFPRYFLGNIYTAIPSKCKKNLGKPHKMLPHNWFQPIVPSSLPSKVIKVILKYFVPLLCNSHLISYIREKMVTSKFLF